MKIEEQVRQKIQAELEAMNDGVWLKVVSEIQYFGDELCFFVLIDDQTHLHRAYEIIRSVLLRYMPAYTDTQFSVSFSEKRDGNKIMWDAIDDSELRSGKLHRPLGLDPDIRPLRNSDVFGVNRS